jgi:hypothetical protein
MAYHRFFVIAVLETPRGNFGQSVHIDSLPDGLQLVRNYEEEWKFKDGKLTFLKTYFRRPPHQMKGDVGLFTHDPDLGLAIGFAHSVPNPKIRQSVRESPSLSVAAVYPGSPAAGSGVRPGDILLALLTVCESGIPCPRAMQASRWDFHSWHPPRERTDLQKYLVVYRHSLDEVAVPRLLPHRPSDEPWKPDPKFHVTRTAEQVVIEGDVEGERWVWTIPRERIPPDPVAAGHSDP